MKDFDLSVYLTNGRLFVGISLPHPEKEWGVGLATVHSRTVTMDRMTIQRADTNQAFSR